MVLHAVLEQHGGLLNQRRIGVDAAEGCERRMHRKLGQTEPRRCGDRRSVRAEQTCRHVDVVLAMAPSVPKADGSGLPC